MLSSALFSVAVGDVLVVVADVRMLSDCDGSIPVVFSPVAFMEAKYKDPLAASDEGNANRKAVFYTH